MNTRSSQFGGSKVAKAVVLLIAFLFVVTPLAPVFAQEAEVSPVSESVENPPSETSTEPAPPEDPAEEVDPVDEPAGDPETEEPKEEEPIEEDPQSMMLISPQSTPMKFLLPTEAKATVDQSTGALVYEYPISLPPGRAGMTPELSLKYNSRSIDRPDSILGLGWELSIPYIKREPGKGTQDLYNKTYFSSSISGNLIPTTDTSSSQYTVYRPEADGGDYLPYSYNSDSTWTVTAKDGSVYTFGGTSASRQDNPGDSTKIYKWMVSKIVDVHGNEIQYSYTKDNGQIYPSQIVYTYHASSAAIHTVDFAYTTPTNYGSTVYNAAFPVITYKLLSTITVTTVVGSEESISTYTLNHSDAQFLKQKLISYVVLSSNHATQTLRTDFSYSTKTAGWEQGTHSLASYLSTFDTTVYNDIYTADFDLNGYEDVLISHYLSGSQYNYFLLNSGTGFTDSKTSWSLPTNDVSSSHAIADVNGDRLPDLLPRGDTSYPDMYLNTGSGFSTDTSTTWKMDNYVSEATCGPNVGDYLSRQQNTFLYDINNDGKNDIVYFGGTSNFKVYLNNGSGWTVSNNYSLTAGSSITIPTTCGLTPGYYQALLDFNGDGLADYYHQNAGVFLNTGSGFAHSTAYYVDTEVIDRSGFADINGDGLLDYIGTKTYSGSNNCARVLLNNGAGFTLINPTTFPPCTNSNVWSPADLQYTSGTPSYMGGLIDVTADGLPDIVGKKLTNGTYVGKVRSISNGRNAWTVNSTSDWEPIVNPAFGVYFDINRDNIVDFIAPSTTWDGQTMPSSKVYMGKTAIPNRLTQVTTPLGAQTVVDYSTAPTNYDDTNVMAVPVVKKITVQNLGYSQPSLVTQYAYADGAYVVDPTTSQKRFAGFNNVTATESGTDLTALRVTKTYFHQGNATDSSNGEYSDHISKIGRVYRTEVKDGSGNIYSKTINKWDKYQIASGINFVKLAQSIDFSYDGDSDHKDKATSYTYNDANGNLTQKVEWGEVTGADAGTFTDTGSDKFTTDIAYATGGSYNVTAAPSTETEINQSSTKVRETRHYYDTLSLGSVGKGDETKTEQWKTSTTYINSQKTYNSFGLVTQETDPRGKNTTYTYDSANMYPATVTNHLSQQTQYLYVYALGVPKQVTDRNGRVFQTTYDGFGRITLEKQPDLTTPTTLVQKASYDYELLTNGQRTTKIDNLDSSIAVETHTYTDGLDRVVQERVETEDAGTYSVKDRAYNKLGLLEKESVPYFSSGTSKTTATSTSSLYSNYTYDPLQRISTVTDAIGTTSNAYDQWKLTTTDPRGKAKDLYKDAYGNLVRVDEHNGGSTYTTNYEYNGNNNLTKITDALSNVRNFTYDGLGRRLTAQDLHASADAAFGSYTYIYDDSGNLTSVVDPKSQTINYTYDDLNRIATEDYTGQGGTEVTYSYDSGTNGVGRLTSVTAPGASTAYAYDPVGNQKQEIKTLNSTAYQTDFTYDRQGNQLEITSPDSSKVKYAYNSAGQLETVQRKESTDGSFINLVTDFDYGPHGKMIYEAFQNGSATTNTYDATKLYRLSNKTTTITGGSKVQDLTYTYDNNGNITKIVDASNTNSSKTVDYTYDDLNRLLSATATNVASGQSTYTHSYTYSSIGNILTRTDAAGSYTYAGDQGASAANPHAVTSVGSINYTYDNNGNMLTETSGLSNTWDYNNRLTQAVKGGVTSTYSYDHAGQRVKLANGTTTTYYPSQFYNTDGATPVKHIFAGDVLIATIKGTGVGAAVYSDHTDHLTGSSVITNSGGTQEELLDYFPFGNVRLDQKAGTFGEKKQFAGSELDADSGLNYMQARYYKSDIGRFISQDPMFWNFDLSWLADPQMQNAYSYARNNPLRYNDPTGESPKEVREALFAARHPFITGKIGDYKPGSGNISTTAADFAINSQFSYNTPGQLGSQRNAFRHVMWQAMITKQFGGDIAVDVGDAHEDNPNMDLSVRNFSGGDAWDQADQSTDLLNNDIGRSIGQQYKNESNVQLAVRTLDYYYNIGVYVAEGDNNGNVKVYQHKISLQEYNMAYDHVQKLDDNGREKK